MNEIMNITDFETEEFEDFEASTNIKYAIWAVGYDADDNATDTDMLIAELTDPDEAVAKAQSITLADVVHQAAEEHDGTEPADVSYISIEVETVVDDEDGAMNVGTIFRKELWIEGEDEEDFFSEDATEVIVLNDEDYTLDEEGNLVVAFDLLRNYNKNDMIKVKFAGEEYKAIFTFKIVSKTTTNNYICTFAF